MTTRTNKDLTQTEFEIVQSLKRAIVDIHNGNHWNAEHETQEALWRLFQINV